MTEIENRLREAIRPFADIGAALAKHGPNDDGQWTRIQDDWIIFSAGTLWTITAGQLRKAYLAVLGEEGGE